MVIDAHVHCAFFQDICPDGETVQFRRDQYALHKTGPAHLEQTLNMMNLARVDRAVLLPLDLSSLHGKPVVSNGDVAKLVGLCPDRFIGFASVDPCETEAPRKLEEAFRELKLSGLKLNLSRLRIYPTDRRLEPLYKLCVRYNKPIVFHAGLSWEPDAPSRYARPLEYEELAMEFPALRFCLAHFGWPWVEETVMLLLKFPNVYTDTSLLYMDSPRAFFHQLFRVTMGPLWMEHNFASQVLFGSNMPRFRPARIREGLESLEMGDAAREKLMGGNAIRFLGWEE